jgi:hypothetical protein
MHCGALTDKQHATNGEIMHSPQLTPDEKSSFYSKEFNRFQTFQNKLSNQLQAQDHAVAK